MASTIAFERLIMLAKCVFLGLMLSVQAEMEGYIVGGAYSSIEKHPHSACLTVKCVSRHGDTNAWICGSSIINQKILLTAAHCLYSCVAGTQVTANMGHASRRGGVLRSASGFIVHEKYNPLNSERDLALLKLKKAVRFNDKIRRVAIMRRPPYNEIANLAGWGIINEYYDTPTVALKAVDQRVWRYVSCMETFGSLNRGTICASSITPQSFPTKGDSGSSLVVRGYIQIGLVSYKIPAVANNVIIYTDVGYFYDWIYYHSRRLYCI